ncbi:GtrA family protein [Streptomyces lutosisoli]|uniref:GtrA family protein n=1 Tax=Streptomyces lutosisoli TaxID=2665721 RepID=A0ABW2VBG1_9ACTN
MSVAQKPVAPGAVAQEPVARQPVSRSPLARSPLARSRFARSPLAQELLGFATAGILAYAADLGLFVWLRGPVGLDPLTAKALSFVAGCSVAYAGNALGTYRHTTTRGPRQYVIFFAVNIAGALVQLLCIALSHYGLGFTSRRADTVSGAGIGMALATVLRFWGTRTLVFRGVRGGRGEGRVGPWTG